MRIFIISHDLSHNCLGRAVLLAQVFGRSHDVEIVGPCFGPDIWFPCRDLGINYRKVEGEIFLPQFTHLFARLLDKLKGDYVIAVKPRPTSFGVALMHRALTDHSIILDIDDDEMAFYADQGWKEWESKVLVRRPNSPLYTSLLETMIPTADVVTVASHNLEKRYGGFYLPHVKDPSFLDPSRFDRRAMRERWDFPAEEKLIVFAGSPREHKGLDLLLKAVERLGRGDVRLLVVGASNDPANVFESGLRDRGGESLYMLKQIPMNELPSVLAMADLVALPQHDTPTAQAQMPSKLFDAMSMALPIVASDVSDIAEVLDGESGLVVPPGDLEALVRAMGDILESPSLASKLGSNARRRLIEKYSFDSVQKTVEKVLRTARRSKKRRVAPVESFV